MPTWIAFIRAIGPETHKKMPMAALRHGLLAAGFKNVRTVLATGNVIFTSPLKETTIARRMAEVIKSFDLGNEAFFRTPTALKSIIAANPFPDAAAERPSQFAVIMFAEVPDAGLVAGLDTRSGPERLTGLGRDIYVDYAGGISGSRLTPGVIERRLRQRGTARNWNTLRRMLDLAT